jgi:hypothetical protein
MGETSIGKIFCIAISESVSAETETSRDGARVSSARHHGFLFPVTRPVSSLMMQVHC